MKIYALSDLHVTLKENFDQLKKLVSKKSYKNDVILLAGDISFDIEGNHDLWTSNSKNGRPSSKTSFEKLEKIKKVCKQYIIRYKPKIVDGVLIIPMFSWYNEEFGLEEKEKMKKIDRRTQDKDWEDLNHRWMDFHLCKWPKYLSQRFHRGGLSEHFLKMNGNYFKKFKRKISLQRGKKIIVKKIITFSHFLPRRDLLPSREKLKFKGLLKVAGCKQLDDQLRKFKSNVHVFGHSHIDCVKKIDGVTYVQNAMGLPRERRKNGWKKGRTILKNPGPLCIYDSEKNVKLKEFVPFE